MADTSSQGKETAASAAERPTAIDLNAPDAQAALAFLVSKGWTPDEVEQLLNKHAEDTDTSRQVEEHLLSLGWSRSDIARLLVGPEKSHLTAETLFRQHAANSAAEQEALLKALAKAGAQDIKPDPSLLSGLNPAHLRPESPADLEQLIVQFAELPDVQKQRFLLLLDSQKPTKRSSAPSPKVDATSRKKTGGNPKPSEPPSDVLPVVKSSLDLLSTALKGLLGTTKDAQKKGKNGIGKIGPGKDSSGDESDPEDSSSPIDEDEVDESSDTKDETTSPSEAEDQMGSGSESEPD